MLAAAQSLIVRVFDILLAILGEYGPVLLSSLLVSLVATPICRAVALRRGIVDRPDDLLKTHGVATPYLGGVAVLVSWCVGIGAAIVFIEGLDLRMMLTVLVAGVAITLIGLFDDLRVMRPRTKLLCCIAVAMLLILSGIGHDLVRMITKPAGLELESVLVVAFSAPVSLFIIVGACNATNLIDGLDGLCSGVLGIISLGFFALAAHLAHYGTPLPEDGLRITLSLAMLGGVLGFLPYNRNPARIFLGDAGSMLLGLNAAVLILLFGQEGIARWMIGALMVFGLPIYDMLLTLTRRWRNNRPLMQGDRSHFYDQLIDRGYSVRQVVAVSYGLTAFFVVFGCATMFLRTRYAILVYALVTLLVAAVAVKLGMVRVDDAATGDDESSDAPTERADR